MLLHEKIRGSRPDSYLPHSCRRHFCCFSHIEKRSSGYAKPRHRGDSDARADGDNGPDRNAGAVCHACPAATPVPTVAPTETPVPTAEPTAATGYEQTGEFRSDTGTYINIVVKWTVTGSGSPKTLKLDTYVESYALVTGDRISDVVFNIDGNVSYASSKAIRLENVGLTQTFLGSTSVDVTSGTDVPVNVTWHFNGTYSNRNIDTIVAEDTIHIN